MCVGGSSRVNGDKACERRKAFTRRVESQQSSKQIIKTYWFYLDSFQYSHSLYWWFAEWSSCWWRSGRTLSDLGVTFTAGPHVRHQEQHAAQHRRAHRARNQSGNSHPWNELLCLGDSQWILTDPWTLKILPKQCLKAVSAYESLAVGLLYQYFL